MKPIEPDYLRRPTALAGCYPTVIDPSLKERTMLNNVRPLSNRVIVRRAPAESTTASGLVIPDNAKEKPVQGLVLAVGPGKVLEDGRRFPVGVSEGDTVLFGKYAGTEIKVNGEDALMLTEDDILAIVEK